MFLVGIMDGPDTSPFLTPRISDNPANLISSLSINRFIMFDMVQFTTKTFTFTNATCWEFFLTSFIHKYTYIIPSFLSIIFFGILFIEAEIWAILLFYSFTLEEIYNGVISVLCRRLHGASCQYSVVCSGAVQFYLFILLSSRQPFFILQILRNNATALLALHGMLTFTS